MSFLILGDNKAFRPYVRCQGGHDQRHDDTRQQSDGNVDARQHSDESNRRKITPVKKERVNYNWDPSVVVIFFNDSQVNDGLACRESDWTRSQRAGSSFITRARIASQKRVRRKVERMEIDWWPAELLRRRWAHSSRWPISFHRRRLRFESESDGTYRTGLAQISSAKKWKKKTNKTKHKSTSERCRWAPFGSRPCWSTPSGRSRRRSMWWWCTCWSHPYSWRRTATPQEWECLSTPNT